MAHGQRALCPGGEGPGRADVRRGSAPRLRVRRQRRARGKLTEIIDAVEPGGSGNPFAGIDVDQREALAALYRFGFPRGAESQLWAFSPWTWGLVSSKESDPGYYDDFWNTAGYLGHDDPQRLAHLVIDNKATVTRVLSAAEAGADIAFVLAATAGAGPDHSVGISINGNVADLDALFGARITFTTGRAAERSVVISTVAADILSTSGEHAPQLFDGVEPGKMIHVNATHDAQVWPNGVLAYRAKVEADKGERTDASYRLWWSSTHRMARPRCSGPR